jgi:fibronectin-binding autotransporter adhesin
MQKHLMVLVLAIAPLAALSSAVATDITWDGDTDNDLYNTANWVGDVTPADGDVAHFPGGLAAGASVTPTVTVAGRWFSLVFESDAPTYSYKGNGLTFELWNPGSDAVINNSSNYQVIDGGGGRFNETGWLNAANGDIVVNAPMYVGSGSASTTTPLWSGVAGSHNVFFNVDSSIHSAGDVNGGSWSSSTATNMWNRTRGRFFMTNFSGTAFLGNIGTSYRGSFHLDSTANGALRLTHNNSLGTSSAGSTGGGVYIYGGTTGNGTLEFANNITVSRYVFQLDGRSGAVADDPHILNVSGDNKLIVTGDWNTGIRYPIGTISDSNQMPSTNGGNWNFQSDSGKLTIAGGTAAPYGSIYNTDNVPMNLQLMGAGDGQIDAPVTVYQANPSLNIIKKGAGTWTLANANNDYTGTTTIEGGTLSVTGACTGGGAFNVLADGRLSGTGSISSTVSLSGAVAPGSSAGTLTVGGLTLVGGTLEYQLDAVSQLVGGGINDLTVVTGALDLSGGATLDVAVLNGATLSQGTYELIQYASLTAGDASNVTLGTIPLAAGDVAAIQLDGNSVNLVITPEPASLALLALGTVAVLRRRRK